MFRIWLLRTKPTLLLRRYYNKLDSNHATKAITDCVLIN